MKPLLRALVAPLAAVLLATQASADWVMVQQVEGMGQAPMSMTIKVKGGKLRMDMGTLGISTIMDAATGEMINLNHGQKMVMRIKKADLDALSAKLNAQVPEEKETAPQQKLVPTGRTEHINGYKADEYTWKLPDGTLASYWIATAFPDYRQLAQALEKMQDLGPISATKKLSPRVSDFPGMPVRTVMETNGQKVTTTVTDVKKETLPEADFVVPAGYKEMAIPQMAPGAPASPGQ